MSLNESIVEDAALEWFLLRSDPLNYGGQVGELGGRRVKSEMGRVKSMAAFPISLFTLHFSSPHLAPGEPAAKRSRSAAETDEVNSFGKVVLVGRLREAIRRLNFSIPEEASACALHADRRATIKRYLQVRFEREMNP